MKKVIISQALSGHIPAETTVTVQGWIRTRRDSKAGISFLAVYDGSCFLPIQVIAANTLENYNSEILHLTAGCSVAVTGKLVPSPAKGQMFELQAEKVEVIGFVENPETYPISPKHHTLEYLRDFSHLRIRTNLFGAIARVRQTLAHAIHHFFHQQGFCWVNTPIITPHDCEGAGELFRVSALDLMNLPLTENKKIDFGQDFFGREAYLTVSGQLNVESYCLALSKVYTFGPTFRAENSNTTRHLAEFWMVEPEIAFANLNDDADLAEKSLQYLFKTVLEERADDMAFFAERIKDDCITRLEKIIQSPFERIDYREAINLLQKSNKAFEFPVSFGIDLQTEHERYLAEELIGRPVIVMNYPKAIKAFYMRVNDDNETVAAMDILAPGIGEIVGGSQREERFDLLKQRMQEFNLNMADYEWYLDLRRYGSVPHAGFGLGFERLISYVTGISNIRDAIPFPRAPKLIGI